MNAAYGTRPIKQRTRSTQDHLAELREALFAIVEAQKPMTVRQVFYRATVNNLVDKSENGYRQVQRLLVEMRRARRLPFFWIVDNGRPVYQPDSFDSPEDAVQATAQFYRKALWSDAGCRVEVWLEKDALSGVLTPVTWEYDVGLYVSKGFASLSFLYSAAETIKAARKPSFIYHLGDYDPSGVLAGQKIEQDLRQLAPEADITFQRLGVTKKQIIDWSLPSRPTKQSSHSAGWNGDSVELDAIDPDVLRGMVRVAIEQHLPPEQFAILKAAEASEREFLESWAEDVL